ncbi:hypothetical protein CR513_04353, partial [Mucuna pruriens]
MVPTHHNNIDAGANRTHQQLPSNTFIDQDFVGSNPKENDPMVITVEIANFVMKKTKPFKEGNISIHVKILTDIELDPKPLVNQGVKPFKKIEYISLTNKEHRTQIGENMQGPHREWLVSTLRNHADLFAWQPSNTLRIDPNVICYHLALCVKAKSVAQ